MKLLGVIVNYRIAALTTRAINGLLSQLNALTDSRIVVVDNDSQDGSLEALQAAARSHGWGDRVEIVPSGHNGGFGAGINFALRRALAADDKPEYVYVLNPDAVPGEGAVANLLQFMDAHPNAGVAGGEVRGFDGELQGAGFRFPTMLGEVEYGLKLGLASRLLDRWRVSMPVPDTHAEVDWITGANLMIRRAALERVGLFDERFFLYYEEIDFCRRVKEAGMQVYFVADARVQHEGSASTGLGDSNRRMPDYWFASRRHYYRKHHGPGYLAACDAVFAVSLALAKLRRTLTGKPPEERKHMLRDFVAYNARATLEALRGAKVGASGSGDASS